MSSIKIVDFLDNTKIISILFIISTLFFVYQHTTGIGWDFSAYVLNAKYWLGQSNYFEWLRPPLTYFILLPLSIFGWPLAEYIFIILVSALFLGACIEFSKAFNLNRKLFYALMLTPLLLNMGFSDGSELLTLSFLMLAVSYFYSYTDKPIKSSLLFGFFMGLAFLCRYDSIVFLPILLFKKPKKEIFKVVLISAAMFLLVLTPWLVYNQISTGNWLTSIVDLYAINIKFRDYMISPPNPIHILAGLSYYLPLFLLGIAYKYKSIEAKDLAMLFIFVVVIVSYAIKPTKTPRYLFNLVLPLACFSSCFMQSFLSHYPQRIKKKVIFLIFSLNILLAFISFLPLAHPSMFKRIALNLEDCRLQSNGWVFLNYYGKTAEPHTWDGRVGEEIAAGNRLLLFKNIREPAYGMDEEFLSQFPIIENHTNYVLLGDSDVCLPPEPYTKTYLQQYVENNENVDSISNCEILFSSQLCDKYNLLRKILD